MWEQNGHGAATKDTGHSTAMGECLIMEDPALLKGHASLYGGKNVERAETGMIGDEEEQKEDNAVCTMKTVEGLAAATALCWDNSLSQKKTQTLMTSFIIKQTLEEKRSWINKQFKDSKNKMETAMGEKDMSASFQLSKGRPMCLERIIQDDTKPDHPCQTPKGNRRVMDIARYLDLGMGVTRMYAHPDRAVGRKNNTTMCGTDKVPILPDVTTPNSTATTPNNVQMRGLGPRIIRPMRMQRLSHVTGNVTSQPDEPIRHQDVDSAPRPWAAIFKKN